MAVYMGAGSAGLLLLVAAVAFYIFRRRAASKDSATRLALSAGASARDLEKFDENAVCTDERETRPVRDQRVKSEVGIVLDDQVGGRWMPTTSRPIGVASPAPLYLSNSNLFTTPTAAQTDESEDENL